MAVYKLNWSFWCGEGDADGFFEAETEDEAVETYSRGSAAGEFEVWNVSPPNAGWENYWEDRRDEPDDIELVPGFSTLKEYLTHLKEEERKEAERIVVLGVDGGFANIGWSAVRFEKGKAPVCLDTGVITTKRDSSVDISADNIRRTREIYSTIKSKIEEFSPAFVAAETPSWTRFPNSDRITAQFWGMLPSIVEEKNLAIVLRTPVQIKSDLAGKKKASKNEMIKAARSISGADDLLTSIKAKKRVEHAADAIGAAISSQKDKLFQTIAAMKRSKV